MLERLAIGLAVVAALYVAFRFWKRPPRRISRLDLPALGIAGPAIVQFTADFCAPCRIAAPQLREAADATDVAFSQVDVGKRPDVARRYGIRTVPTIVVADPGGRVLGVWTSVPLSGELTEAARRAAATRPAVP